MDIQHIRELFPILNQEINGEPLIYFDNAATSQTPISVVDAMVAYYQTDNANIHRGVHALAERATQAYEGTRQKVAQWLNAQHTEEIIFNRGTTEGLNFLAQGLVEPQLNEGDLILTTKLEHHSNLVPWQEVCQWTGASLEFLPLSADWTVDLPFLDKYDDSSIKALVIHHVSNVLGVEQSLQDLSNWAHERGALLIVDGAQAVPHLPVDVQQLGVDAYCFSGHKMYGPTGIGAVYLKASHHETTQPVQFGGEMIHYVGDLASDYKQAPWKFEAGTMPISQVVGLGAAIDFIADIGYATIGDHESKLVAKLCQGLDHLDGVTRLNQNVQAPHGLVSFNIDGVHPHDAATAYDLEGIAVRAGHHCAQPLMRVLDTPATLRASVGMYNTLEEVERFIEVTEKVRDFFKHGLESTR